jgi:hypothetical protein
MPNPITPLTDAEKAYFDTIRAKAREGGKALLLQRMLLDGKPVAMVATMVYNRFTEKPEGVMPLAILVDDDMAKRLRTHDGEAGVVVSPHDLDPGR